MKITKTASGNKIKLSKNDWKAIGKKAGWIKTTEDTLEIDRKECQECHGEKFIYKKLKNLGTLEYDDHYMSCPTCDGKGYSTKEDRDNRCTGIGPCPHNKPEVTALKKDKLSKKAAVDLRCPNCGDNLGKDRENPRDTSCSNCGENIHNPRGYVEVKCKGCGRWTEDDFVNAQGLCDGCQK